MQSRIKVIFIKAHRLNGLDWKVGHMTNMRTSLASELIEKRLVKSYNGQWPPKRKTKINLKDLQ